MSIDDDVRHAEESMLQQRTDLDALGGHMFEDKPSDDGFSNIDQKTNMKTDEIKLCLINEEVFDKLGLSELCPTRKFKRLVSSREGWKTEKFVQASQSQNEKSVGIGGRIGRLFGVGD